MNTGEIKSFIDLHAWQEGHRLVLEVYSLTENFPDREIFGITNQMRRAVVSVTSNISEGFSRKSDKDKSRFYSMALGLLTELQNQTIIARDVGYCGQGEFAKIKDTSIIVSKLINGLIKSSRILNT
jgi:four helix bundle protein